jgi:hypothetical protein
LMISVIKKMPFASRDPYRVLMVQLSELASPLESRS